MHLEPVSLEYVSTNLSKINHRGHQSHGFAGSNGEQSWHRLRIGYVRGKSNLRTNRSYRRLAQKTAKRRVDCWCAHCRYSTVGNGSGKKLAQPLEFQNSRLGTFYLAHNGQVYDYQQRREGLKKSGYEFSTDSDSEVLGALIARSRTGSLPEAVANVVKEFELSYSLLVMNNQYLVAARDRFGNRPLWWAQHDKGIDVASETAALPMMDASDYVSVPPGSVVSWQRGKNTLHCDTQHVAASPRHAFCAFEAFYFMRPDCLVNDSATVADVREALGRRLAQVEPVKADLVVGVPESGLDAAWGYAQESSIAYGNRALIRNHHVVHGRSFTEDAQAARELAASLKCSIIPSRIAGKRIVLIDDTMVRMTTMRVLVARLRDAGAAEIHVRIPAPKVVRQCYFGIDIATKTELPAAHHCEDVMAEQMEADSLAFLPWNQTEGVLRRFDRGWCGGCLSGGEYPVVVRTVA